MPPLPLTLELEVRRPAELRFNLPQSGKHRLTDTFPPWMVFTLLVCGLAGVLCVVQAQVTDQLDDVKQLIAGACGVSKQRQKLVIGHKTVDDLP